MLIVNMHMYEEIFFLSFKREIFINLFSDMLGVINRAEKSTHECYS